MCASSEGFDGFLSDKLFLLAADHKINKKAQRLFNSLPEALSHMHTETLSERQLSACYGSNVEGFLLKLIQWLQPIDWSHGDTYTGAQVTEDIVAAGVYTVIHEDSSSWGL